MHDRRTLPRVRPSLTAISWRAGHVARRLAEGISMRCLQAIVRIRTLRRTPRALVIPIERILVAATETQAFDPAFYRTQNGDVADSRREPLDHYLRFGWREGRAPNARFDDAHYRAQSGLTRSVPVSPLGHFLAFGNRNGLSPVPGFDAWDQRRNQPDLAVARMDPYQHLLQKQTAEAIDTLCLADIQASLVAVPHAGQIAQPLVDVIVPVYAGRAETLNTLRSVLAARNETPFEIIVVNDCTPDAALGADLRDLAARELITLIEAAENRGFVHSINTGMACHDTRDVLWLNADTEVYDGWIDRLRRAAYQLPRVATVTPLTNNGTICSYPRPDTDNPVAPECGWAALNRFAANVNDGAVVETPTAVGFATYVRRDAIRVVGMLDEAAFGRGYGEENDFSQRAEHCGWANLVAADVFVRHFGATSFKGTRADRVEAAMKVIDRRYPGYRDKVRVFQQDDPLGGFRRALDIARLRALSGGETVLFVTHSLGGGTQQHVQEEIARLRARGASVFVLSGGEGGATSTRLAHAWGAEMPGLAAMALDDNSLWTLLGDLRLSAAHIHHLIDFAPNAVRIMTRRLAALKVPYDFVLHDYYPVCPRINLVDTAGVYCGEPDVTGCQRCLTHRGSRVGRVSVDVWRADYGALLCGAARIRVPDRDGADRLRRYFPMLSNITVVPHEASPAIPPRHSVARDGPLRICVIGAIGATKGFDSLLSLARHCRQTDADASLHVIGYTRNDAVAEAAGITVTGAYLNSELDALIEAADPDLIWIPSLWPETFCYTLSFALRSGRAVAAFDLGAQARRIREHGHGSVIPLELAMKPALLLKALRSAAGREMPALL